MTVRMTAPGAGESFRAGPVGFRVLDDGTGVNGRLGVVEVSLTPGWPGPPQHIHREHDETFYVVTGTVRFTSGADTLLAPAGSLITAPIGDPHTFGNADDDEPALLMCTVTPEKYLGYFRELAGLHPRSDGLLDPAQVLRIMKSYATDPYHG